MKCPNCKGMNTLKAKNGSIPISQDVIFCTECKHILDRNQTDYLEREVVRERMALID